MKKRHAWLATAAAMALALALAPSSWGQEDKKPSGTQARQQPSSAAQTIHGVIAGITTEGEVILDYRTNRAIEAEGAFLTVVGSPMRSEKGEAEHRDRREDQKPGGSSRKRADVYIVWLSPRTKVCECTVESGKSNTAEHPGSSKGEKKECSLEKLEIGDHVEMQFQPRDESSTNQVAHQTERIRSKHGRHRTHVGYATEVTILVPKDQGHSGSGEKERSK